MGTATGDRATRRQTRAEAVHSRSSPHQLSAWVQRDGNGIPQPRWSCAASSFVIPRAYTEAEEARSEGGHGGGHDGFSVRSRKE